MKKIVINLLKFYTFCVINNCFIDIACRATATIATTNTDTITYTAGTIDTQKDFIFNKLSITKMIEAFFNCNFGFVKKFVQHEPNSKSKDDLILGEIVYENKKQRVIKLQYVHPNKNYLIASGNSIKYYDSELDEHGCYKVDSSPISILLKSDFSIKNDVYIDKFSQNKKNVFVIFKKKGVPGYLKLIFLKKGRLMTQNWEDFELTNWIINDVNQKKVISLTFYDEKKVDVNKVL